MGSFFTSLHVRRAEGDRRKVCARVAEVLTAFAKTEGLVKTSEKEADRTILLRVGDDWISIYDEWSESQDFDVSDALGGALSRLLGAPAITVVVHDSDVLELRLFDGGKIIDRFNNAPSYFARASEEEIGASKGKPARWQKSLGDRVDIDALRRAWRRGVTLKPRAAHEALEDSAAAIGLPSDDVMTGFNALAEGGIESDLVALRFRRAKGTKGAKGTKATTFEPAFQSGGVTVPVGTTRQLDASVRNAGSASAGLSLLIAGESVGEGLVTIESLAVALGVPAHEGVRVPLERWNDASGRGSFIATLADAKIPEGIASDALGALARTPAKYVEALGRASVHVTLTLRGARTGSSRLTITVVPEAHPAGAIELSANVVVTPMKTSRSRPR